MGVLLGPAYSRSVIAWFIGQPDGITLGAFDGEHLVGYVLGTPPTTTRRMSHDLRKDIAIGVLRNPLVITHPNFRGQWRSRLSRLLSPKAPAPKEGPQHKLFDLVAIGVSPVAQGKGTAKKLLGAFCDAASDRGFDLVDLEVYDDNGAALAAYRATGFQTQEVNGPVLVLRKSLKKNTPCT